MTSARSSSIPGPEKVTYRHFCLFCFWIANILSIYLLTLSAHWSIHSKSKIGGFSSMMLISGTMLFIPMCDHSEWQVSPGVSNTTFLLSGNTPLLLSQNREHDISLRVSEDIRKITARRTHSSVNTQCISCCRERYIFLFSHREFILESGCIECNLHSVCVVNIWLCWKYDAEKCHVFSQRIYFLLFVVCNNI